MKLFYRTKTIPRQVSLQLDPHTSVPHKLTATLLFPIINHQRSLPFIQGHIPIPPSAGISRSPCSELMSPFPIPQH